MQRFRDLVHTRRSWLVVGHDLSIPNIGIPQEYRQQFTTLQSAIAASRPGDTILLEPGLPHEASNVLISHPLHILGGSSPDHCIIHSSSSTDRSTDPVLIFAATGRISNITLRGGLGGCIAHYSGRVEIEDCTLRCHAKGLRHLASPLVSLATSVIPEPQQRIKAETSSLEPSCVNEEDKFRIENPNVDQEKISTCSATSPPSLGGTAPNKFPSRHLHRSGGTVLEATLRSESRGEYSHFKQGPNRGHQHRNNNNNNDDKFLKDSPANYHKPLMGPGQLLVSGCAIQGGCTAVRICGTGSLRSVRAIYESHKTLFWFGLDSSIKKEPNLPLDQQEKQPCGEKPSSSGNVDGRKKLTSSKRLTSSWLQGNFQGFEQNMQSLHDDSAFLPAVQSNTSTNSNLNFRTTPRITSITCKEENQGWVESEGPSWMTRQGAERFDPGALQNYISELMTEDVEKKAEAWKRIHAASIGGGIGRKNMGTSTGRA